MTKNNDIQAIAFDLDGTLVDSVPGLAAALKRALATFNLPTITEDNVKVWIGNGIDVLLQRALKHINASETWLEETHFIKLKDIFNQCYDQEIDVGTKLYPHVEKTLKTLQENGYPMALVTNKPAQFLPALLSSLGIDNYFSLVQGGGDVIKLKPHPAPLYQVMATFGLFNDQLLFVGDSRNDITAAKNAACPTVGLTYGYNYGESIANSDPDYLLDHFEDLLTLLPLPKKVAIR